MGRLFWIGVLVSIASAQGGDSDPARRGGLLKSEHLEAIVVVDGTWEQLRGREAELTFNTNHEYIILGLHPFPETRFLFEVLDRTYWEFQYDVNRDIKVKLGKIAIPFGPIFLHQVLGGLVEKPLPGGGERHLMIPHVWAEYGAAYEQRFVDRFAYHLSGKFWVVNGLQGEVKAADRTVDFTSSGGEALDNNRDKGLGLRLQQKFYGKYGLNFSFYTAKWSDDGEGNRAFYKGDRLYLGNADAEISYNSLPYLLLKNLRFRIEYALLRTEALDAAGAGGVSIPRHYKSASFLEATYNRFHEWFDLQFRFGTYDDNWDVLNGRDLININAALYTELYSGVHLIPMYMWNLERVNAKNDDFFFIKFFLEL